MKNQKDKLKLANTKIEIDEYTGAISVIFYTTKILELTDSICTVFSNNTSSTTIKRINQMFSRFNVNAKACIKKGSFIINSEDVVISKNKIEHVILIGSASLV